MWITLINETGPECVAYAVVDCSRCAAVTTEHGDEWTTEEAELAGREEDGKHSTKTSALLSIDGPPRPKQEETIVITVWKRRLVVKEFTKDTRTLRHTIWIK